MPRLFTGLVLPWAIVERLAALRAPLPGAKWVEPENLHITLRFAGDIDNRTASEFADFLAAIDVAAFELRISGLGAFGGNDPRSIWAGVEAPPELDALARANERAARAAGLAPESRTFKPHVTLARLRNSRSDAVAKYLQRNGAFRTEPIFVDRFALLSSRPLTGGGPYVIEESFLLQGADPVAFDADGAT